LLVEEGGVAEESGVSIPAATPSAIKSDVDVNIPSGTATKQFTYVLAVGNEDYKKYQPNLRSEQNVEFAYNDAEIFAKYANKTLGVPEKNIFVVKDATSVQLKRELTMLSKYAEKSGGKAELIFYYAGHGQPHPQSAAPYLIPVDVTGDNVEDGIRLAWAYQTLTKYPLKRVTVFLDACFSGDGRSMGLVAARSVAVKSNPDAVHGKLVVFASSKGSQTSQPYREQQHGLFTYHLLKKLQSTKGNLHYGELSDYLKENVSIEALHMKKEQDPNTQWSVEVADIWEDWRF
jgi:uncharacterized caspase-like protein